MISLLRKESAALGPFWFAFGVLVVVNLGSVLWDASFVTEGLGQRFSHGGANATTLWLLSFFIGHGAVAHELRDGHVEFLDALPVARWQVYGAKLAACLLPVLGLVVASFAMDVFLAWLARPPEAMSPLQPILVMHAVMLACGLGGLGMGMLLSWLGPLAWGVLGLAGLIMMCTGTVFPAVLGWLPLLGSLGELEWIGSQVSHPVGPPVGIAILGGMGILASGALFVGPGRLLTERGSQAVSAVRISLVGCLAAIVLPIGGLFALMLLFDDAATLWHGTEAIRTPSFRVLHVPGGTRGPEVAATVDDLSARVGAAVGNPEPLHLDVEVLGAPKNHLGVFTGGKIRLATDADDATLAHELAHAHAYALAGPAGWSQHDHTHFFDEGLADWARARVMGDEEVPAVSGAIWATDQARFEDLVERSIHLERHDIRQAYALGQAFVASLVQVEGPEAPACMLRALGEVGGRRVAGLALWYGIADTCGVDLDAVIDRWFDNLQTARARLPEVLPRLRVGLPDSGGLRLEVRDENGLGWPLRCGFRDGPEAPPERWAYIDVNGHGECFVPFGVLSGHSFQYQVGYRLPGADDEGLDDVFLEWTDAHRR